MRTYDVVIFGATGFTGRQAVDYFRRHAPPGLRWAIAGRDRTRLTAVGHDAIIVADSNDASSVDAMVKHARVLVNTAGPFARYGTPVVDACVRFNTDYADITGETFWVSELVDRYHEPATAQAVRIVPGCGFDSVPSDLAAMLLARRHHASSVRGYFQLGGGGLNGGTIASISHVVTSGGTGAIVRWSGVPLPHRDDWVGTWVGPFFMAPTNTWVVRRSARLLAEWNDPYPEGFEYHEVLKYDAPFAVAKCLLASSAIALFGVTLRLPAVFRVLERFLPRPGEGPSEQRMDEGWFSCVAVGKTATGQLARVRIENDGDAGNRSTIKMLCESAFCLALGDHTSRGGVLTPATALGTHLVERLRRAGMRITP
jgi:short subunit dehydrogenase-like uncharacterized protein